MGKFANLTLATGNSERSTRKIRNEQVVGNVARAVVREEPRQVFRTGTAEQI